VEEVTDEPLYRDRVCGIDIGKAELYATIRVPSDKDPARRMSETRCFPATRRGVLALADWMRCWQVPALVMEATSDYWKPVLYRLEAEGFECVLADARQVKNLPGRPKRDPSDSSWLAQCFERGSVRPCFVADPEFRIIRLHTRYRRDLTEDRTREKNRAEKLLESAAIKLSSVVTDLHGVTGRDIMDHLIAGERNPKVLAQLARGRARRKISDLEQALDGAEFFTPEHAALLQTMLARIDQINTKISELDAVIEQLLAPWEEQLQQAGSMPGWGRRSAQDVLAESGSPGALPRRGPLGTVLARYQAHGSGKPLGRCGLWCWRPAAAGLWLAPAGGVYQAGSFPVRRAVPVVDEAVGGDGPAGRAQPPAFPFPGGLGRLLGAEQVLPAERAAPVLPGEQAQAVAVQRGFHPPPPRGPVVGQVRVVG
jgi:transposase